MANPIHTHYLTGAPGSGKTSQLVARLVALIESNTRPDRILVLVSQQAQAERYREALTHAHTRLRGEPEITTLYGLAYRHVALFYPLIAARAGFADATREPTFINVELTQYFLDQLVAPRAAEFDDLKLYRPRLLGQILDNMNKAAQCGFRLDEIATRLSAAWSGDTQRQIGYQRAQDIAQRFREFCLQHALLDVSLLTDTFAQRLLHTPTYQDYIAARYRHVLADNIEENPPVMHDFLRVLLRTCDSAILAEDNPGGYRLFLGADVESARALRSVCDEVVDLGESKLAAPKVVALGRAIANQFDNSPTRSSHSTKTTVSMLSAKYWGGMVSAVAERVIEMTAAGTPAHEIAIVAPFVEDVLRFELEERLRVADIGVRGVRPSRPLYDHPMTRAMIALAKLAHPQWSRAVSSAEIARALSMCIADLDIVRAQLIADAAMRISTRQLMPLTDQALWNRVGMRFYERYHTLQSWLNDQNNVDVSLKPLDLFWQRLLTHVLTLAGFRVTHDADAMGALDKLIRSARNFREAAQSPDLTYDDLALRYIDLLAQGIMAAQAFDSTHETDSPDDRRVLLAPVYAYLTSNFTSRVQIWLDVQSLGWYERIYQPLTHPYVLSRRWQRGQAWTEVDEHRERREMLRRVIGGLVNRCREQVIFASSRIGISGQEDDGPLLRALARVALTTSEAQP